MKKCPFCAEEIQDEAVKCRFCSEYLGRRKRYKGCLIGCLLTSISLILLTLVLSYLGFLTITFIIDRALPGSGEFYRYPPFLGFGFERFMHDFAEGLKGLLDKLKGLFCPAIPEYI